MVSRNLLSAPFFDLLKKVVPRIVLVVHEKKKDFFEKYYGSDQVIVAGVSRRLGELDYLFKDLAAAAIRTRSRRLIRKMRLGAERWNAYKIFFWAPLIRPIIPTLYSLLMPKHRYADLFIQYHPNLLITTDVFNPMDVVLSHEAKYRGIKVVGMVRSWDNLTAKGGFRVIPDTLIVNNEIIKSEAVNLHGIPASKIKVVGVPHYDKHLDAPPMSRAAFYRKFNLQPEEKIILYAPIGNRFFTKNTFDGEMVTLIREILPVGFRLFVRCPPGDLVDLPPAILQDSRVIVHVPGTRFAGAGERVMDTELSPEDDDLLAATLYYSELLISGFTTLVVDAARFDKPVILVGFDARTPLPKNESVRRHLEFDHFQPILASRGVRVAANEKELADLLQMYLADPTIDRRERRAMVMAQAYKLDGQSSKRLVECVDEELKRQK